MTPPVKLAADPRDLAGPCAHLFRCLPPCKPARPGTPRTSRSNDGVPTPAAAPDWQAAGVYAGPLCAGWGR